MEKQQIIEEKTPIEKLEEQSKYILEIDESVLKQIENSQNKIFNPISYINEKYSVGDEFIQLLGNQNGFFTKVDVKFLDLIREIEGEFSLVDHIFILDLNGSPLLVRINNKMYAIAPRWPDEDEENQESNEYQILHLRKIAPDKKDYMGHIFNKHKILEFQNLDNFILFTFGISYGKSETIDFVFSKRTSTLMVSGDFSSASYKFSGASLRDIAEVIDLPYFLSKRPGDNENYGLVHLYGLKYAYLLLCDKLGQKDE